MGAVQATGNTPEPLGYLYVLRHSCWDGCWSYSEARGIYYAGREPGHECYEIGSYPITKTTAKRIYFRDDQGRGYSIDRAKFDDEGCAYHRRIHTALYQRPPVQNRTPAVDLPLLKQAMADAHPDRGGTDAEFIAARQRYENARRAVTA